MRSSTVRVFRSRGGPGPRRARCPRAGRRALVVRGAAAAGRALRSPRRAAAPRAPRASRALRARCGRCARGARLRERAATIQHHRTAAARGRPARAHRSVCNAAPPAVSTLCSPLNPTKLP